MQGTIQATVVVAGSASGEALVSTEPLSFWGGYDHRTGEIIDRRHPLSGERAAGRILMIPFTRGSSTTTAVLLEAVRSGTAPAAIITHRVDAFVALASVVAEEMYARPIPIFCAARDALAGIATGDRISVSGDGVIRGTGLVP